MGTRDGAGVLQGVEIPRPLVSSQKSAQTKTNHQKTPIYGAAQERLRMKNNGGGKEARDWRHNPPWYWQGQGRRLRMAEGGVVRGIDGIMIISVIVPCLPITWECH